MQIAARKHSTVAAILFDLLNPIAFGLFVAALIFDVVYDRGTEILWLKSASWLIAIGLLFAVLPRLINLVRVWLPRGRRRPFADVAAFWLNLCAIAAAILNAFVHSRDAYAAMPGGVWLSVVTVGLLMVANVVITVHQSGEKA